MREVKSESRRDRYRRWFRLFDANGDEFIDQSDYVVMSERIATVGRAGGAASGAGLVEAAKRRYAMIAMADTDGDGRVSEDEYLTAALQTLAASAEVESLHDALARGGFASFDVNGDGVLDLKDYVLTHTAFGLDPRLQDVVDRFQHWDANGDGVITLEEFLTSYKRHQLVDEPMPFYFCAD